MAEDIQKVMEAVSELRKEVEKSSPDPEKIIKIEKSLEAFETRSQELVSDLKTSNEKALVLEEKTDVLEKSNTDLKTQSDGFLERVAELEIEIARGGGSLEKDYKDSDEYKALAHYAKEGEFDSREQKAFLRTDSDVAGGFLVPSEMDNMITKKITEVSNIRALARVRTIGAKSMEMPVRATIPIATYEGEAEEGNDSVSTYENETITTYRQTFTSPITMDMLMDAAFDMESEIMGDAAEAFALGEGNAFVNGLGAKTPKGFLQDSRITGLTSSTSSLIDADDVILISGELKVGYSPTYTFNRRTLAALRTLKSTDGNFLWAPGLNGVVANTINGFPYLIAEAMPNIAANSKSIAFGDFLRGYTIVDRTGLSVIRDELTLKKKSIVEFTLNRWNTGQVTLPEAIKILTTAP